MAVEEALIVNEGLLAPGRRLHHPAEVHSRARAAVVAGRALGDRYLLGQHVPHRPPLLRPGYGDVAALVAAILGVGHMAGGAARRAHVALERLGLRPEVARGALLAQEIEEDVAALLERWERLEARHRALRQRLTLCQPHARDRRHRAHA